MTLYDGLAAIAREFGLRFRAGSGAATLTDPATGRAIEIFTEEYRNAENGTVYETYIVGFSTQHRHAEEAEDALDFVREILRDAALPIEFYLNGARRFGGDLTPEEAANLSVAALSKVYGLPAEALTRYEYEITSWSGRFDTGRRPVSSLPAG